VCSRLDALLHKASRAFNVQPSGLQFHDPNAQASSMEIVCISFTVRTSAFMVRTLQALIWKLRAAKVQPSGR
jgi:hypothetical protein